MPQTDDSTQDYRSKISYPQLGGDISGTVSNSGITVAPTPAMKPTAASVPSSGSIPSSFSQPQLMAPAATGGSGNSGGGGSGSGGGPGGFDTPAPATKPQLSVNIAPRRFISGQDQQGADAAATWGQNDQASQPVPITAPQGLTRDERNARTARTNQGPTDPAMRKQMGLPPLPAGGGSGSGGGGGSFDKDFNTQLAPQDEQAFATWKAQNAPNDSGADYDLRGAYKAGVTPDAATGHWPDTFKKPNHPTFSDQSQYAQYGSPGKWNGDTFVPPAAQPAAIQPAPLGTRAAQAVKSAAGTAGDYISAANDIASIPGKVVANAAGRVGNAVGTVASDFGKEMMNGGGSQILPPGSPAATAAAAPAKNPNAVDADSPAPGQWPPLKKAPVAQPKPALLGGNGIMDKPIAAPTSALTTPGYGNSASTITAPTLQATGPLPKLEAKDNQSIFEAMVNLGGDISRYKAGNAMVQQNFKNMLEASKFNMENLSKMTEVQSKFTDEQRKNFDTQLKSRTAEAVRQLALGPKSASNPNGYDPAKQGGLRILAGMEKTQDIWKPHEVLLPRAPGQELLPQEKVTVFENTKTGAIVPFDSGMLGKSGNTVTRAQADQMKAQGRMSDQQLADYLKKNGKTIAGS